MLGWFGLDDDTTGAADRVIEALARELRSEGWRLAGAVQRNLERGAECACEMELEILGEDAGAIRISQSLGSGSTGCRLDTGALALAAGRVEQTLDRAELLIVPKFGQQEAAGEGFRQVIGVAMSRDLPVILHVPRQHRAAFAQFAGDLAQRLAPGDLRGWCAGLRS